jgi:hypothetical protein
MPEELGKIEKPPVEEFKGGKKLYFIPLIFSGKELPVEYTEKYNRYWEQVEAQIANLESKLGPVDRIFHELVTDSGEEGLKALEQINESSYDIIRRRVEKGATLEATEDREILTELMDWSRCLSIGLQSQTALTKVYDFYNEVNKKRNEHLAKKLNECIKDDETGILVMGEGHHVQFSSDIRVFYVAPPALDEIKRWMRDYEAKAGEHAISEPSTPEQEKEKPANNQDSRNNNQTSPKSE